MELAFASFFAGNNVAMGLLQLLLTVMIMVINQKFFISGFKGLLNKSPNMDTLVALGSGASFLYSVYALFAMTDAQVKGDMTAVMAYMHEFLFRICGDDPDTDPSSRQKDAWSTFERKDNGCTEKA